MHGAGQTAAGRPATSGPSRRPRRCAGSNVTGGNLTLHGLLHRRPAVRQRRLHRRLRSAGTVINGSQQQFLVRDSSDRQLVQRRLEPGVRRRRRARPRSRFPQPAVHDAAPPTRSAARSRTCTSTPPAATTCSCPTRAPTRSGTTWANGAHARPLASRCRTSISPSRPTPCRTINAQLARGKNLLLTPGRLRRRPDASSVKRPDTVVLGLGHRHADRRQRRGPAAGSATSRASIVAGLMIDAGPVELAGCCCRSAPAGHGVTRAQRRPTRPPCSDVFFRIGGPHVGKATVSLEVNSDNVLLDDIWAWRADHGVAGSVGWDVNTGRNGVIVNGDDVTATGLFVEHYQQYNVIWNGERGQHRLLPERAALRRAEPGRLAARRRAWAGRRTRWPTRCRTHELWGGGSYIFTNVDPTLHAARGFEVPVTPGRAAARPADRVAQQRRHHRPRRQRHRRPGHAEPERQHHELPPQLPLENAHGGARFVGSRAGSHSARPGGGASPRWTQVRWSKQPTAGPSPCSRRLTAARPPRPSGRSRAVGRACPRRRRCRRR